MIEVPENVVQISASFFHFPPREKTINQLSSKFSFLSWLHCYFQSLNAFESATEHPRICSVNDLSTNIFRISFKRYLQLKALLCYPSGMFMSSQTNLTGASYCCQSVVAQFDGPELRKDTHLLSG